MSRYVVFEGVEGAGKSTVMRRVADALGVEADEVVVVREPGGTALGEAVRELLLHGEEMTAWAEALLFAAQRSQLAQSVIRPALARGAWVLGDRSVYSSLAYQGHARGLGVKEVRQVNEAGLGGTWPDRVVYLRTAPAAGLGRQRVADRIGGEGLGFVERVAAAYEAMAADDPDRFIIVDVDGLSVDEVTSVVMGRLAKKDHHR